MLLAVVAVLLALAVGMLAGVFLARRQVGVPRPAPPALLVSNAPEPGTTAHLSGLVLQALDAAVIVLDRSEAVILTNQAALAMGLVQRDRLVPEPLAELARRVLVAGMGAPPQTEAVALPLSRLGREPAALTVTALPLPDEHDRGVVVAVALLLQDDTESRRLEDVRRDFVANVSHELKTPVGALVLLAEAVQEAADDPEAVAHFASRMQHEGSRLSKLIRELIELSRLQGGEALPGEDQVLVIDLLDEAQDRTTLAAAQAGIEVISRCAGDLRVRGNETQLANAVTNLLDNAIAYSPQGTRVALSARLGRTDDDEECVEITVTDQGMGIAESELARVFERFYRVDPARSRATGGTGLGLAIVKHVATNHGGSVSVWSVEGEGSTFTISMPLAPESSPACAAQASTPGPEPLRADLVATKGPA